MKPPGPGRRPLCRSGARRRSREYDFSRTVIAAESTRERGRVLGAVVFSDTDILSFSRGAEGAAMTKTEEYALRAREAEESANRVFDPEAKRIYRAIAQQWREAAEQLRHITSACASS